MPKTYKYDFCITGGGPAGCAAAYIAAKSGLKCALIEKNNYLGGLMTGGLVIPVMKSVDSKLNRDFYFKLVSNLTEIFISNLFPLQKNMMLKLNILTATRAGLTLQY